MSDKKDKTTRDQALRVARMLGCQGAHETDAGWMPCSSHEEYEGIKKGKEEYLKVRASNNKKPLPKMVQRTKRLETKSDAYYENRADAVAISKARGCGGVRTVLLAGKKYYAVCDHKAPKRGWENLDEKPITGIATLPGGGLVTGSFSGKSLGRPIGGVAEFDGDGDGFSTGPDGEDNIPIVKLPDVLTTDALKKMRSDVNPDFLDPKKSSERHGDEEFSAAELMKLPAENAYNLSLLDSESAEYLENQRQINSGGMNQRIRQEGVFYPIILREWADGKRSIHDGHHRLIAAYDNHPDFRVPVFVWKEEGKLEDENKSVEEKGFVNFVSRSTDPDTFSDPESARIRARNLGCIGIRRYTARDGKLVWLPCTNVSDYNRVTGIRGDNSPINNPRRQGSGFKKKSEMDEKALGRSIGGYRRMFKPIGGVGALEDGDGDGFATGADGEDNIPVAKVPKPKDPTPKPVTGLKPKYSDYFKQSPQLKKDFEKHIQERVKKGESTGLILFRIALFKQNKPNYVNHYAKLRPKLMNFYYEKYRSGMGWRALDILMDPDVPRGPGRPRNPRKKTLSEGIILFKGVPKPKKKPPTVTSTDINNLAVMVRKNNAKAKTSAKTNLRDLKVVFVRGLTDGGREEANRRVSKFLSLLNSDKPKDVKYSEDNDLLPIDHPWKNRKTAKKWADFEEGEYGVKYAGGCCPKVVKRYRPK